MSVELKMKVLSIFCFKDVARVLYTLCHSVRPWQWIWMCSVSCHEEGQPGWSIHQFISPNKGVKERCISQLITIRSDLSDHIHAREQFSQLDQQHYPHLLSTESNNFPNTHKGWSRALVRQRVICVPSHRPKGTDCQRNVGFFEWSYHALSYSKMERLCFCWQSVTDRKYR